MPHLFDHLDVVDIWERYVEDFVGDDNGRSGARALAAIAATAPITLHCLSLSLASPTCLDNRGWLAAARRMVRASGVDHISDHLGLQIVGERRVPHFVPVWRTQEQLDVLVENVSAVQDLIGARLAIENTTMMLDLGGEIGPAEMLSEVARRTGCAILLDLENVRVNAANNLVNAEQELADFDLDAVVEIHLAGTLDRGSGSWELDAHDAPIRPIVFDWLRRLLPRLPNCEAVILERDQRFADADDLLLDLQTLHTIVDTTKPERRAAQVALGTDTHEDGA